MNKTTVTFKNEFILGKIHTTVYYYLGKFKCMEIIIVDNVMLYTSNYSIKLPKTCGGEKVTLNFSKEITGLHSCNLYSLYNELVKEYFDSHPLLKEKMQNYHFNRALKYL